MTYRGYKGWRPNSRRHRRGRRTGNQSSQRHGSRWSLVLVLGLFALASIAVIALMVYNLR